MRQFWLLIIMGALVNNSYSQARIMLNGGNVVMQNGSFLVLENAAGDALTPLATSGGITTDKTSFVRWYIGSNAGSYTVPYYFTNVYIPFSFTTAGGIGGGYFDLNSYNVPTWKNSDHLPTGVTNVNSSGVDNSNHVIDRFWSVSAMGYTTKPSLNNVSFGYRDEEWSAAGNVISEPLLKAQRWNSNTNTWNDYAPTGISNAAANNVAVSNIMPQNLYQWWALVDAAFPLPVTLLRFSATVAGTSINIQWTTTFESNTAAFVIERSRDGIAFRAVDTITARGSIDATTHYQTIDPTPLIGRSFYRLRMVDQDATYSFSSIAPVWISKGTEYLVYPNPVVNKVFVDIGQSNATALILSDAAGKTIIVKAPTQGINEVPMNQLPSGIYWLKIIAPTGNKSFKIVKE